jgi:hypothetical protein
MWPFTCMCSLTMSHEKQLRQEWTHDCSAVSIKARKSQVGRVQPRQEWTHDCSAVSIKARKSQVDRVAVCEPVLRCTCGL